MPVQQISVASNGKSAPRSKLDKNEGGKAPGKSGSRSSNVSKPVEEDPSAQKKQVKRRHRRKTSASAEPVASVDSTTSTAAKQQEQQRSSPPGGSDRSLPGSSEKKPEKKRLRTPGPRRERVARDVEPSSSEGDDGEAWREARSWTKEKKARRRHRSQEGSERDGAAEKAKDQEVMMDEVMELRSVCSQEGKGEEEEEEEEEEENQAPPENREEEEEEEEGGLKKRGSAGSTKGSKGSGSQRAAAEERESSHGGGGGEREQRSEGSGSSSPAEEGEELITKRYQETGAGGGDMSAPTPQNDGHHGENCGTAFPCSDDSEVEVCKICHCEGDEDCPLITPCHCTGSLRFVHQDCLNQWIKSSDTRCCELCNYDFIMETQLKPLRKWEKLSMSTSERRKIYCSVLFHLIAIGCVLWSVYVLVRRTADEIRMGRNEELMRISLANYKYASNGVLDWPFWTKLIVVAIGFTGGLIFMYIQCKVYLQLWHRLKAFNRIITVQNCPPRISAAAAANGKLHHDAAAVEVPLTPVPVPVPDTLNTDSECSVEAAVAPAQTPV